MTVMGYILFALALVCYVATVKAIWILVSESNGVEPQRDFNRFWWMPAWKVHRRAFPKSSLRRQIVTRFILTFALVVVSTACVFIGLGVLQRGVAGR